MMQIRPGQEADFETTFAQASPIIASMPGYIEHELRRSLEVESKYLLLVRWVTLADHMEGFRNSDGYQEWRRLLHPFYDPMPTVEHYESVYTA